MKGKMKILRLLFALKSSKFTCINYFQDAEVVQTYGFIGSTITLTAKIFTIEEVINVLWFKNNHLLQEVCLRP